MTDWNSLARHWRNGRVMGALVVMLSAPLWYWSIQWMMADRLTVAISAPDHVSVLLAGDPIPKKSAQNYRAEGRGAQPLEYVFDIDPGNYALVVELDDGDERLERQLVVAPELGQPIFVTITDDGERLAIEMPR